MKHFLFVILALEYCIASLAADYTIDTVTFKSELLNEDRQFLVFIPSEISDTDSCTIIYMLDGEFSDYRYRKIADEKRIEPLIGVGIVNTDRRRDLLPANGANKFLESIASELIPLVEKDYTIKKRIIYGHSFAGAFTLYAMLNKPRLFDKFIASSPTPIMDIVDSSLYIRLDSQLEKEVKVYFSCGSKDMKQVRKWSGKLNDNLLEISLDHIKWEYEIFEGEDHNTSGVISLINGISY